jgi:hypothetical protein
MAGKPMTLKEFASLGGKARALKLSKERRSEIAKLAVTARENKRKQQNGNNRSHN